ncbi:MAG: EcsC family protein [Agriterribacter sp.]|nr:MAG: ABC transporter-associated protein EcsC [Sphingobacteriales bacterium 40-81]
MSKYTAQIIEVLKDWRHDMLRDPSLFDKLSRRVQTSINKVIPEKVHQAITAAIKQMVRGVLFGAEFTTGKFDKNISLQVRDALAKEKIDFYKKTAAAEGGITGAGGILLGLADFPLLLGIKMKLLFELASVYGIDIKNYKERVYILYIFQLAFSSPQHRRKIFLQMNNWEQFQKNLPEDIHEFDWRTFQQEYRDYIDLAKMAQLVPVIGAPVGAIVNYRLINKLGKTAMNAYRLREIEKSLKN